TTQPLRQDLFAAATAVATAQPRAVANLYRPRVAPPEAVSVPIGDSLAGPSPKQKSPTKADQGREPAHQERHAVRTAFVTITSCRLRLLLSCGVRTRRDRRAEIGRA